MIHIEYFFILSGLLFFIGVFGFVYAVTSSQCSSP